MMKKAFALPTILLASTLLMIVLVVTAAATASISRSLSDQYFNRQAKEAAQSALTYARYCYNRVSGKADQNTQWPYIGSLTESTDCYGAKSTSTICPSTPAGCSLTDSTASTKTRTTFDVWVILPPDDGGASYTLDATGTVQVLRPSGGVVRTYTRHLQQVVSINLYGIASGNDTTCSIQAGQLYCWGNNSSGQVGNGNTNSPVTIPYHVGGALAGKYVQYVATGISHTCAVVGTSPNPSDGNSVYCWGDNSHGQFGNGTIPTTNSGSTTPILGGSGMAGNRYIGCTTVTPDCTAISARDHTCVITEYSPTPGSAANVGEYCWGKNNWGQAGLNSDLSVTDPKTSAGKFFQITDNSYLRPTNIGNVSGDGGCAVMTSAVYCWGANVHGELGNGTHGGGINPKAVATNVVTSGVTKVTTNNARACAIKSGALYCWGANGAYNGTPDYRLDSGPAVSGTWHVDTPVQLVSSTKYGGAVTDFAITDWNTCIVVSGKVYCSGYNDQGQLGQGNTSGPVGGTATSPSQVRSAANMVQVKGALDGQTVTQITSGNNHFCAITDTHESYCWGDNSLGQLGNGTTDPGTSPTRVHIPVTIIY